MKLLMKKACECGRKIVVKKNTSGKTPNPECSTCRTYGLAESRRLFLEANKKSDKTKYAAEI